MWGGGGFFGRASAPLAGTCFPPLHFVTTGLVAHMSKLLKTSCCWRLSNSMPCSGDVSVLGDLHSMRHGNMRRAPGLTNAGPPEQAVAERPPGGGGGGGNNVGLQCPP